MDVFKAGREAWQDAVARIDAELAAVEKTAARLDAEAGELLAAAEAEQRELTPAEQSRFDRLLAEHSEQNTRAAALRAEERAATEQALGLRQAFATAKPAASRVADARNGVLFDQTGRAIGDVFENQMDRMMSANVISHKLPLRVFRGREEDAYYAGHWLRAMIGRSQGMPLEESERTIARRGWQIQSTATTDPGHAGGYTVPDPLSAAFVEERKRAGIAMQLCDVRSMNSDTLNVPRLTAGPVVRYPGEAASITPSDQTWNQLSLLAKKRAILEKISNELMADSVIDLAEQVVSRMAHEFSLQQDNELINGDGSSTYGGEVGLLAALGTAGRYYAGGSSTSTKDTWGELVLADFTSTMGLLRSEFRAQRAWIMSTAFFFEVALKLVAAAGGNTIQTLSGGLSDDRPQLLGYPVFLSDWMPTTTGTDQKSALFGSFSQAALLGDREPLALAVSTDRFFDEDCTALRGVSRYDINVHSPGTASTPGAYVCLSTSAS